MEDVNAMRDSLLSRFRGAFQGALLGEAIGSGYPIQRFPWQSIRNQVRPAALLACPYSRLLCRQTNDFLQSTQRQHPELSFRPIELSLEAAPPQSIDMAEVALAAAPVGLFYHDQPVVLQAVLQSAFQVSALPSESRLGAIVIGHTLSLLLRERCRLHQLIPHLVHELPLPHSPLLDQLLQIQTWIEQPTELATMIQWTQSMKQLATTQPIALNSLSIALALYGFLSTPNDFSLTVLRLVQLSHQPPLTCMLAGLLSGLYNGWAGLPLSWRQQLWRSLSVAASSQDGAVCSEPDLFQLTDRLLASWSGAIHPADWGQQPTFASMTAAPRLIRLN